MTKYLWHGYEYTTHFSSEQNEEDCNKAKGEYKKDYFLTCGAYTVSTGASWPWIETDYFKKVDSHALETVRNNTSNLEFFVRDLASPFESKALKIRSLYSCILEISKKDTKFKSSLQDEDASVIFQDFAERMGIKSKGIKGNSRSFGSKRITQKSSWSWNVVEHDGKWYYINLPRVINLRNTSQCFEVQLMTTTH